MSETSPNMPLKYSCHILWRASYMEYLQQQQKKKKKKKEEQKAKARSGFQSLRTGAFQVHFPYLRQSCGISFSLSLRFSLALIATLAGGFLTFFLRLGFTSATDLFSTRDLNRSDSRVTASTNLDVKATRSAWLRLSRRTVESSVIVSDSLSMMSVRKTQGKRDQKELWGFHEERLQKKKKAKFKPAVSFFPPKDFRLLPPKSCVVAATAGFFTDGAGFDMTKEGASWEHEISFPFELLLPKLPSLLSWSFPWWFMVFACLPFPDD